MSQITLHQFPPAFGLPNASPFCIKIELLLRMLELDYSNHYTMALKRAPKGKLPYLSDDNHRVADSEFICDYLINTYRPDFDKSLTPAQHGLGIAISRMLNEHLYWAIVYTRWIEPQGWSLLRDNFFHRAPKFLRPMIGAIVQKNVKKALWYQGTGRHSRDEIYQLAIQDLQAIDSLLPDSFFLFGDEPSRYDCSLYAFLVNILVPPVESPLKEKARSLPSIVRYTKQLSVKYFGEFDIRIDNQPSKQENIRS